LVNDWLFIPFDYWYLSFSLGFISGGGVMLLVVLFLFIVADNVNIWFL